MPEHVNWLTAEPKSFLRPAGGSHSSRSAPATFELVARLAPDDWMRLTELVEEDG